MDISSFGNTLGRLEMDEEKGYYCFVPANLPVKLDIDSELLDLLLRASKALGELKSLEMEFNATMGFSATLFIRSYLKKEAVLSSKIEGTVSTLYDVFEAEESLETVKQEMRMDLSEVLNYVAAQEKGISMIEAGSTINTAFVAELHSILLRHVRGERDRPGKIRDMQNYISRAGFPSIGDAVYVPPKPSMVNGLLDTLFKYMSEGKEPGIIKVALMHYQFEAIHPFLDGNGRIGRLLIMLYLIKYGDLGLPLLYMSAYFERNRKEYYRLLLEVSRSGAYSEWVKFFMNGVIEQSESTLSKSAKLFESYNSAVAALGEVGGSAAPKLANVLFMHPIITIARAAEIMGVSYPTAKAAIYSAARLGILEELEPIGGMKRPKRFVARRILDIYDA